MWVKKPFCDYVLRRHILNFDWSRWNDRHTAIFVFRNVSPIRLKKPCKFGNDHEIPAVQNLQHHNGCGSSCVFWFVAVFAQIITHVDNSVGVLHKRVICKFHNIFGVALQHFVDAPKDFGRCVLVFTHFRHNVMGQTCGYLQVLLFHFLSRRIRHNFI